MGIEITPNGDEMLTVVMTCDKNAMLKRIPRFECKSIYRLDHPRGRIGLRTKIDESGWRECASQDFGVIWLCPACLGSQVNNPDINK